MQNDFDTNHPELGIQILGVNGAGFAGGNGSITSGRDAPWLQDLDGNNDGLSDVWASWGVAYRDVVILDADNAKVGTFNLTTYNLQVPENYDTLRQLFINAATVPEPAGLTLMAIGAAGLFPFMRRRKNYLRVCLKGM